jgi:hypothetical protein
MDINDRLYVEIHPLESGQIPHPHPVTEARFDITCVYKVLGMYNPSETSECYFVLSNPQRQIWFIPQRHVLAFGLLDSDEFFIPMNRAAEMRRGPRRDFVQADRDSAGREKLSQDGGHALNRRLDTLRASEL